MPNTYIIRAKVDAANTNAAGIFASDWFDCGINDRSDRYPTADAALIAARTSYKGPDEYGIGCRVWAERSMN